MILNRKDLSIFITFAELQCWLRTVLQSNVQTELPFVFTWNNWFRYLRISYMLLLSSALLHLLQTCKFADFSVLAIPLLFSSFLYLINHELIILDFFYVCPMACSYCMIFFDHHQFSVSVREKKRWKSRSRRDPLQYVAFLPPTHPRSLLREGYNFLWHLPSTSLYPH